MAAHANRVLSRSTARSTVRLAAAMLLALVVGGVILGLRQPAGSDRSASVVSDTTAGMTEIGAGGVSKQEHKFVKPSSALGTGEDAASLAGSGASAGTLLLQVRDRLSDGSSTRLLPWNQDA